MADRPESRSVLTSSEVAFPRGGASVLSALEVKEISNEATRDVLFETAQASKRAADESDQPSKKQKRSKKKKAVVEEPVEKTITVDRFSFRNLFPGCTVLGQITKIGKMNLTLSLGNNLLGFVPITSISEEVTALIESYENGASDESDDEDDKQFPSLVDIFSVGLWVRAQIVPVDDKENIKLQLTIEPQAVNAPLEDEDIVPGNVLQASVKSVEDHGVLLNTGRKTPGFISNKELEAADISPKDLHVGEVLLAAVVKSTSRNIAMRPAGAVDLEAKKTFLETISSIDAVQPGTLVKALVAEVTSQGIVARVFGMVDASVNLPHLNEYSLEKLQSKYPVGSTISTRVVGVLMREGVKKLVLSALPHILSLAPTSHGDGSSALEAFPIGHIFQDGVEIIAVDDEFFYVSFGSADIRGQVHKSRLSEDAQMDIEYTIGTRHRARVLGFNTGDDVLSMTFDSKVIDSKFLSSYDVPIGEYFKDGEVVKILPDGQGMIVKIFNEYEGIVPANHISDIKLSYPERKFKIGSKVKGRVLNKSGKKLLLTLRKSFVGLDESEILGSFEKASVGFKTAAVVDRFVNGGAIITFFGYIRALLPKSEISETFVTNIADHLKVGQTVTATILTVDPEEKRLVATLRQSLLLNADQLNVMNELECGKSVVNATVAEKNKDAVIVEFEGSNLRGIVAIPHLSDRPYDENRSYYKKLQIGQQLEVLVLDKDFKARAITATAKESLVNDAKNGSFPVVFEDIKDDGSILHGYIKSVTNLGLFVTFAGRLTGLVLARHATGNNNEDLFSNYYRNQSVACQVVKIDNEERRFLLALEDTGSNDFNKDAINPVDESKKSLSDYTPGVVTKGVIKSVKNGLIHVQLAENLQGKIDVSQCFNSVEEIDSKEPMAHFKKNDVITVKVIGYHDPRSHQFSASLTNASKFSVLELSVLERELKAKNKPFQDVSVSEGAEVIAYVQNSGAGVVWASISPAFPARIGFTEILDEALDPEEMEARYPSGTPIKATVRGFDKENNTVILTSKCSHLKSTKDLELGSKYVARVIKTTLLNVVLEIGTDIIVAAYITDALDDYTQSLEEQFHSQQIVNATVTHIDDEGKVFVSLRGESPKDKVIDSIADLTRGGRIRGFVQNTSDSGLIVTLGRAVHALVRVRDLSDGFLKEWKLFFKPGQPVHARVMSCENEGRVLLSLRESEIKSELSILKNFEDLQVGDIYEGYVMRTTDYGVFVRLDGTYKLSGLCHRSQIADTDVADASALFGEGDRVKVKVLALDAGKRQMSLGMKASFFTDSNEDDVMEDAEDDSEEEADSEDADEADENSESEDIVMEDASDDEEESEDEEEESKSEALGSGLSTNGFDWTASILDQAEDNYSSSDEEDFTQDKKKKKKGSKHVEDKTSEINTRAPQSVSDFERLLVGNPNSSVVWMNYMSFQLQLSEVDKAREIGERALKTITFREEQEKMNIWIAMLNLENTFGDDDTLEEVFKRSTQYMDSLTMHQKLVSIYTMSEKFRKADMLYKTMTKKFGKHVSVWVQNGSYYLERDMSDQAHEVLARALQVLPKREHIEVVRKFAQLEFSFGDPEQGRSLFEGLISDAPKRIDLWNVYIDQEIKKNEKKKAEDLFERVITKKMSKKQAKFFFSKWLTFEEEKGDEQATARVKALATEYVQKHN